jgi:hypothetical protein
VIAKMENVASNLGKKILSYINESEDGRKPNELRDFIKNIDDKIDSELFLQTLFDEGSIAKYKFKYYTKDK